MLYEYKIIICPYLEITEDELNCLGQEGWNLAGMLPVAVETARLIFTRQVFYSDDSRDSRQIKTWTNSTTPIDIYMGRGMEGNEGLTFWEKKE